ncbi:protein of unknown function [Shewanella benthica]|uniref:Uncharacterized protein n=1 Tax=Shewanella benthica TaxID=43661 RepID=A0A330M648_9GAMM|nr:protein of unknown function [Shewanella benthica]
MFQSAKLASSVWGLFPTLLLPSSERIAKIEIDNLCYFSGGTACINEIKQTSSQITLLSSTS